PDSPLERRHEKVPYEQSDCHKEAVERHVTLPARTKDIGETLSAAHSEEKANNRAQLMTILRNICFLSRQGLALRGHDEEEGNFMQLLKLHGQADPTILSWIEKKSDKYTSPPIQNEIIQIMALGILRKVANSVLEDAFFTIMVDETTDVSNGEQVVLVLRNVDSELNVQDFIGLYVVPSIDAQTITNVIKDTLLRMRLQLSKCRGQCYDGASNIKRGVAANITAEDPKGHLYTLLWTCSQLGCYAGLAVREISKLVKFSPKRDGQFEKLRKEMSPDTPGFRVLCPTRWTVRAECLKSVLDNYSVLQKLWDTTYETTKDTETRARIVGVKSQMAAFDFLYGVTLGYELLKHSDK
ncbi:ZMYM1-like protein, partial [Mya arenaria]